MRSGLARIGGFSVNTILLAIGSLLMIPVLIRAGGPDGWAAVASGQALGAVGGVLVGFGWGVSGPASVAAPGAPRKRLYFESLRARCFLFVSAVPPLVAVAFLMPSNDRSAAAVGCFTTAIVGLSATWYFVGVSRPSQLLLLDGVPRFVGTVLGAVVIELSELMVLGLLVQALSIGLASLMSSLYIGRLDSSCEPQLGATRGLLVILRSQTSGIASSLVAVGFSSLPVIIVQFLAPRALPQFAILDKLVKLGTSALPPIVATAQGWVPSSDSTKEMVGRVHRVRVLALALSLFGVLPFAALLSPHIVVLLAGETIEIATSTAWIFATVCSLTVMEALTGRSTLPALGRTRELAFATVIGAVIGLLLVCAGAIMFGVNGALAGVSVGLATTVTMEILMACSWSRQYRKWGTGNARGGREFILLQKRW